MPSGHDLNHLTPSGSWLLPEDRSGARLLVRRASPMTRARRVVKAAGAMCLVALQGNFAPSRARNSSGCCWKAAARRRTRSSPCSSTARSRAIIAAEGEAFAHVIDCWKYHRARVGGNRDVRHSLVFDAPPITPAEIPLPPCVNRSRLRYTGGSDSPQS